jgi:hypothetical protein
MVFMSRLGDAIDITVKKPGMIQGRDVKIFQAGC